VGNRTAGVLLDSAIDRVDLDRVGQMVGEIDHHAQAEEE
jgi:hypothetical protein